MAEVNDKNLELARQIDSYYSIIKTHPAEKFAEMIKKLLATKNGMAVISNFKNKKGLMEHYYDLFADHEAEFVSLINTDNAENLITLFNLVKDKKIERKLCNEIVSRLGANKKNEKWIRATIFTNGDSFDGDFALTEEKFNLIVTTAAGKTNPLLALNLLENKNCYKRINGSNLEKLINRVAKSQDKEIFERFMRIKHLDLSAPFLKDAWNNVVSGLCKAGDEDFIASIIAGNEELPAYLTDANKSLMFDSLLENNAIYSLADIYPTLNKSQRSRYYNLLKKHMGDKDPLTDWAVRSNLMNEIKTFSGNHRIDETAITSMINYVMGHSDVIKVKELVKTLLVKRGEINSKNVKSRNASKDAHSIELFTDTCLHMLTSSGDSLMASLILEDELNNIKKDLGAQTLKRSEINSLMDSVIASKNGNAILRIYDIIDSNDFLKDDYAEQKAKMIKTLVETAEEKTAMKLLRDDDYVEIIKDKDNFDKLFATAIANDSTASNSFELIRDEALKPYISAEKKRQLLKNIAEHGHPVDIVHLIGLSYPKYDKNGRKVTDRNGEVVCSYHLSDEDIEFLLKEIPHLDKFALNSILYSVNKRETKQVQVTKNIEKRIIERMLEADPRQYTEMLCEKLKKKYVTQTERKEILTKMIELDELPVAQTFVRYNSPEDKKAAVSVIKQAIESNKIQNLFAVSSIIEEFDLLSLSKVAEMLDILIPADTNIKLLTSADKYKHSKVAQKAANNLLDLIQKELARMIVANAEAKYDGVNLHTVNDALDEEYATYHHLGVAYQGKDMYVANLGVYPYINKYLTEEFENDIEAKMSALDDNQ